VATLPESVDYTDKDFDALRGRLIALIKGLEAVWAHLLHRLGAELELLVHRLGVDLVALLVMTGVAAAFIRTKRTISRLEGGGAVALYAVFTAVTVVRG
jgi:Ca2+/Na+ antiporter